MKKKPLSLFAHERGRKCLCILSVVVGLASFSLGQSGAGTLSSVRTTVDSGTVQTCLIQGARWAWKFTDPSGVAHTFPESTESVVESGKLCGHQTVDPQIAEWSTDNLYLLEAQAATGYVSSLFIPEYKVISILYSPPGNQSFQGYSNTTTDGTTTTVGNSFTFSYELTLSTGVANIFDVGGSTGYSVTTGNSSAYTQTISDATSVSSDDNSNSTYNPLKSDAVNHNLDTFVVWLNPQVQVLPNETGTPTSYVVGSQPTPGLTGTTVADVVLVPAVAMEVVPGSVTEANPSGVTSVPLSDLEQQPFAGPNGNLYMPGLAAICKSRTYYPNNCSGDPNGQCGCVPSDFAGILATDQLLNYPGQQYAGTVSPLQADSLATTTGPGSGPTVCGENPIPANSNCRYVTVPLSKGSTTAFFVPFGGSDHANYMQSDSNSSTLTTMSGWSNNVGLFLQVGPLVSQMREQFMWTWSDTESTGVTTGETNTMTVNLQTSTTDCTEDVSIFEDTLYHTFVFQVPTGANGCNPAATPTFSLAGGTYTSTQTVTISDATTGATIYYTTNGTTPTTSSHVYTGPITVSSTETLQAIATAPDYETSILWSAAYIIE